MSRALPIFAAAGLLVGIWIRRLLFRSATAVAASLVSPPIENRPAEAPQREEHEKRDASAKWIFGLVLFLFISGLAIHGILAGYLSSLKASPTATDQWGGAAKVQPQPQTQNVPRLQVSPPLDLQKFQAQEELKLNTYGWINHTAGVVRLPIQKAMELILQEGLPTRSGSNADQNGPSSYQLIQHRLEERLGNQGQQ